MTWLSRDWSPLAGHANPYVGAEQIAHKSCTRYTKASASNTGNPRIPTKGYKSLDCGSALFFDTTTAICQATSIFILKPIKRNRPTFDLRHTAVAGKMHFFCFGFLALCLLVVGGLADIQKVNEYKSDDW
jgi:hypothetical protein